MSLANLVRAMNCYYSNLIEGHDTHPVDIERALKNDYSKDPRKRDLQLEAKAHITVQKWIDDGGLKRRAVTTEGIREIHPDHKNLAVFGHFDGVGLDDGAEAGDTVIVRLETKWFWLIPVARDRVSVGLVMEQDEFAKAREKETPAQIFERVWKSSDPCQCGDKSHRFSGGIWRRRGSRRTRCPERRR